LELGSGRELEGVSNEGETRRKWNGESLIQTGSVDIEGHDGKEQTDEKCHDGEVMVMVTTDA
jgi:hypothetical protein